MRGVDIDDGWVLLQSQKSGGIGRNWHGCYVLQKGFELHAPYLTFFSDEKRQMALDESVYVAQCCGCYLM
jgi:hypothetical protein